MVKLILVFIVSFLLGGKAVEAITFDDFEVPSILSVKGGVITMEDVLLHVVLDNPTDRIKSVIIRSHKDGVSWKENGCPSSNCTYDLGLLEKGLYEVTVISKEGSQFTETIYL